jgi:hypothetical protein
MEPLLPGSSDSLGGDAIPSPGRGPLCPGTQCLSPASLQCSKAAYEYGAFEHKDNTGTAQWAIGGQSRRRRGRGTRDVRTAKTRRRHTVKRAHVVHDKADSSANERIVTLLAGLFPDQFRLETLVAGQ